VIWAATIDPGTVQFNVYTPEGVLVEQYDWEHGIERFSAADIEDYIGNIGLLAVDNQVFISLYIAFMDPPPIERGYDLYVVSGYLDYLSSETADVPKPVSLNHYPNPFYRGKNTRNEGITISFDLPEESPVKIEIFNIKGQLVRTILNETMSQGNHIINWDGRDNRKRSVTQGIYFYRLDTGKKSITRKMLVLS
jgi:hypothetical protein